MPEPRHLHGPHSGHTSSGLPPDFRRIEILARDSFRLGSNVLVRVAELACTEKGFPPWETRINFWSGNAREHQYRVFKPAVLVTRADLPPWWMRDALVLDEFPFCDCCG